MRSQQRKPEGEISRFALAAISTEAKLVESSHLFQSRLFLFDKLHVLVRGLDLLLLIGLLLRLGAAVLVG